MRKLMDQMHRGLGLVSPGSVPRLQIARVPYSFEPMDEKPCKARVQNIPFIRYEDFFQFCRWHRYPRLAVRKTLTFVSRSRQLVLAKQGTCACFASHAPIVRNQ